MPSSQNYQITLNNFHSDRELEIFVVGNCSSTDDQLDLVLTAGDGGQTVHGGDGNDTIIGGDVDDILVGGAGDDAIHSGIGGTNIVSGGADSDTLYSDASSIANTFYWGAADVDDGSHDVIYGFRDGTDTIDIGGLLMALGLNNTDSQAHPVRRWREVCRTA